MWVSLRNRKKPNSYLRQVEYIWQIYGVKASPVRKVEIPKPDGVTPNEIPNYINQVESRKNWVEQKFINIFINSLFRAINNKISLYLKLLSNLRYRLYFMGI